MKIIGQGIKGLQLPVDVGGIPARLKRKIAKLQCPFSVCKSFCRCSLV